MKKTLIVHFGAGKCGSSTVQKTLTFHPDLGYDKRDQGEISYWLLHGRTATKCPNAKLLPLSFDYFSSSKFNWSDDNNNCIHSLVEPVLRVMNPGITIISFEGFAEEIYINRDSLISNCNCSWSNLVDIFGVFITRDIISLVESSYLQWGIWDESSFPDFINDSNNVELQHGLLVDTLSRIGLTQLFVSYLGFGEIFKPFSDLIEERGFARSAESDFEVKHSNKRVPLGLLRFLLRHRDLRKVHDPRIEFLVGRLFEEAGITLAPARFSIGGDLINNILSRFKEDRILLSLKVDSDISEKIQKELDLDRNHIFENNETVFFHLEDIDSKPEVEFLDKLSELLILKLLELDQSKVEMELATLESAKILSELEVMRSEIDILSKDLQIAEMELMSFKKSQIWRLYYLSKKFHLMLWRK